MVNGYIYSMIFVLTLGAGINLGHGNASPFIALFFLVPVFGKALGYF